MAKSFFSIGPFAAAQEKLDDFTSSLYLQKLYVETVEQMIELQEEYETAVFESNDDVIKVLAEQIKFLENVVSLANNNMTSYMSGVVSYD